jgi:hypothetical protein
MSNAEGGSSSNSSATGGNNNDIYKRHLRKTNSWHPAQQIQVKQNNRKVKLFSLVVPIVQICPEVKNTNTNNDI